MQPKPRRALLLCEAAEYVCSPCFHSRKHEFIQRNAALQLCCPPRPCGSSDVLGSHVRCREAALLVSVGAREHGTVGGHVSEGFLDSWRSAAPFCMSTDGPSSCQWCTRSARSGRTARGRCGARTHRARASQRTPSCTAGLAEGAAAALPRRAWRKELLWL